MTRHRLLWFWALAALGAVAAAIAVSSTRVSTRATAGLRLKWVYSAGFGGAIMAANDGLFLQHGVDVQLREGGPGIDPVASVAAGTDKFGIIGADQFLMAVAQGRPLVAIALENRNTFAAYITLDPAIRSVRDFPGRLIGRMPDDTYTVVRAMLIKAGISPDSIKWQPVTFDMSPLLDGRIAAYPAYVVNQPPRLALMGRWFRLLRPVDEGIHFAGNVYFTTRAVVNESPATVQGFVNGLLDGWTAARANPDRVVTLALALNPSLDSVQERTVLDAVLAELGSAGDGFLRISAQTLDGTLSALRDLKLLAGDVDLSAAVDGRFVDDAYQRRRP